MTGQQEATVKRWAGIVGWLLSALIALFLWVQMDNLTTTRTEIKAVEVVTNSHETRITRLEAVQPEDRKLLERIDERSQMNARLLAAIAERLNVKEGN